MPSFSPGEVCRKIGAERKLRTDFSLNVCGAVATNLLAGSLVMNRGIDILLTQAAQKKTELLEVLEKVVKRGGMCVLHKSSYLQYFDASFKYHFVGFEESEHSPWSLH